MRKFVFLFLMLCGLASAGVVRTTAKQTKNAAVYTTKKAGDGVVFVSNKTGDYVVTPVKNATVKTTKAIWHFVW